MIERLEDRLVLSSYTFTKIADTNGSLPFGIPAFGIPAINSSREVAFNARLSSSAHAIFAGRGGTLSTIAVTGMATGVPHFYFEDFFPALAGSTVSINDSGTVAFTAGISFRHEAVFIGNGGPITQVGPQTVSAPFFDPNFYSPSINNSGAVAYSSPYAIYSGQPGAVSAVVDLKSAGSQATSRATVNDLGALAFSAFAWDASTDTSVQSIRTQEAVIVDTNGPFNALFDPAINDSGTIVFYARLDSGGTGIFSWIGGETQPVAQTSGAFSTFFPGMYSLNSRGKVAFSAELDSGDQGIFVGPDSVRDKVIQSGDQLDGSTVTRPWVSLHGLNDRGAIAFLAVLADGRIGIFRADPSDVNSTTDDPDGETADGICDTGNSLDGFTGVCTLRAAIEQANAHPGIDRITFDIPGSGIQLIRPLFALPTVTDPVVIDGTTQPGDSGMPLIELDGALAGSNSNGLNITAGQSTVRGLHIHSFTNGIRLSGAGDNVIEGNYLGIDAAHRIIVTGNSRFGLYIEDSARNQIGRGTAQARNIISGNSHGLAIVGRGSIGNIVEGNFIGMDRTGTSPFDGNFLGGVLIEDASANTLGGTEPGAGNLISGNTGPGVKIYGLFATDNQVVGNTIGPQLNKVQSPGGFGNNGDGVVIDAPLGQLDVSLRNRIASNIIAFNRAGVHIASGSLNIVEDNTIQGNFENGVRLRSGVNFVRGNIVQANSGHGVLVESATNFIGGGSPESRNYILGNAQDGVRLDGPLVHDNRVQGNFIGTDFTGTFAVRNGWDGVFIGSGAHQNYIGTDGNGVNDSAEGNVISGNWRFGIEIWGSANSNVVAGNFIGTGVTGSVAIANGSNPVICDCRAGVSIGGSSQFNRVGTNGDGVSDTVERNVISGNAGPGVQITGGATSNNVVAGNYIGTDVTGTLRLGNAHDGILIHSGAHHNTVGGTSASARNVISGNGFTGVEIDNAQGNTVLGNFIGTDVTGQLDLGNSIDGLFLENSPNNTIGGSVSGSGNLISGNNRYGVYVYGTASSGNQVLGNFVGTDASGTADVGNSFYGVLVHDAPNNVIGASGSGNVVSGNDSVGIYVFGNPSTGNLLQGNLIGTNASGTAAVRNTIYGVLIQNARNNVVGGTIGGSRNVISGNGFSGVRISGSPATGNKVQGNFIGTNAVGNSALGNFIGVEISSGPQFNVIGTDGDGTSDALEGNVISGNASSGVSISNAIRNEVAGNRIGTDATGTAKIRNTFGVLIQAGAKFNQIGTDGDGLGDSDERNVISGNGVGVQIQNLGTEQNFVAGNLIGTKANGAEALGNEGQGIVITSQASANRIGTNLDGVADDAEANVISGNDTLSVVMNAGILLSGHAAANLIQGNRIGTNAAGTGSLGNLGNGISLFSASTNTIGGTAGAAGNIISANAQDGIYISGNGALAGAISWWRAEANASDFVDGNHATLRNGTTFAPGKSGQAFSLDGVDDLVDVGGSVNIAGSRTISAWVYLRANSGFGLPIVTSGVTGQGDFFGIAGTSGSCNVGQYELYIDHWGFSCYDSNIAVAPDTWNHVVVTFDGASVRFFVNGVAGDSIAAPLYNYNINTFDIGGNSIGGTTTKPSFNGLIDEFQVFNRALTPTEIQVLFQAGGAHNGGNDVLGNVVGTGVTGTAAIPNASDGIEIGASLSNRIGLPGAGNVIAFNGAAGVFVLGGVGNGIRANSIFSNTGLGINLGLDAGVTPNDTLDTDIGPNDLQNFPVLRAVKAGTETRVVGKLNSLANATYTLDFYASTTADASAYGEGERWLGSISITTDGDGNSSFDIPLPETAAGEFVSATATDSNHNTSEFSGAVMATGMRGRKLVVGGGPGDDTIRLMAGSVIVTVNDVALGSFEPTEGISVYGLAGEDDVAVDDAITLAADVFGGPGDDTVRGGSGGDLLDGEDGNDVLSGGDGNDVLRGGVGNDTLNGEAGDDVLDGGAGNNILVGGPGIDDLGEFALTILSPISMTEASTAVRGQLLSFAAIYPDPDSSVTWDFGDDSTADGASVRHTFAEHGTFVVEVSVLNSGNEVNTIVLEVNITIVALQVDPSDATRTALVAGGTVADDEFLIRSAPEPNGVDISLDGVSLGQFNPSGRIMVFGQAGDDNMQVVGSMELATMLHGDAGNDRLKGGGGNDILLGGDGDDLVIGGSGRDLLIGGIGRDRLVGNADEDILIAGTTDYDNNEQALCDIMKEWMRADADYATRVGHLRGDGGVGPGLNGSILLISEGDAATVQDDGAADVLTGSAGHDWFLLNLDGEAKDKVTDLSAQEFANDLDFIGAP